MGPRKASFEERQRNGDRWFLALVDPLLDKPFYYRLRKPVLTFGFLEDCDETLPCEALGIDVIADSRRLDDEYNPSSAYEVHKYWHRQVPAIGERKKNPFFQMEFDADEKHGTWTVKCRAGRDCRVRHVSVYGDQIWHSSSDSKEKNPRSELYPLIDGDVFEFVWPFWHYGGVLEDFCVHEMPPQRLRFVLIGELADEQEKKASEVPTVAHQQRSLTRLPPRVLARIASYLDAEEFYRTLAVVSPIFTSAAMKQSIPWRCLFLDNTFDSLRLPQLALPEAVRKIECLKPWDTHQREYIYGKWKPLLQGENVKCLEIHDPLLLSHAGVPPNLEELRLIVEEHENTGEFWEGLKTVQFPLTVKKLTIACIITCLDRHCGCINDDGHWPFSKSPNCHVKRRPCDYLDPVWLFSAFPKIEELRLFRVPFRQENWRHVPGEFLDSLTHLAVDEASERLPIARMRNLVHMNVRYSEHAYLDIGGWLPDEDDDCWQRLESVTVKYDAMEFQWFLDFLEAAPHVQYLKLTEVINKKELVAIFDNLPLLRVLLVLQGDFNLTTLPKLIRRHSNIDVVSIVESRGSVDGVTRDSFLMQGENATVRWESWTECRGSQPKYTFFFSRLSDEEYGKLLKRYLHEPFDRDLIKGDSFDD